MLVILALIACGGGEPTAPEQTKVEPPPIAAPPPAPAVDAAKLRLALSSSALPKQADNADNPITPEKVALGRMLYFDARMSKNQDISCNTCHLLDKHGVDGLPTSTGHKGQKGGRNAPTVYNAALAATQFWDGRAADVEAQAKGPVLNPIEMGMPDADYVVKVIKSIPGYADPFAKAFPGDKDPITYDNIARAIGAFERTLITPARLDTWVAGDDAAMTPEEVTGADLFVKTGCPACHNGPILGGGAAFQKLGMVVPYETADLGRYQVTKNDADKFFFKVPTLRNIAETGPYFHDGSIATLDDAVTKMAKHQLGKDLTPEEVASIVAFLKTTTADIPADLSAAPELPPSGPKTPKPDPT